MSYRWSAWGGLRMRRGFIHALGVVVLGGVLCGTAARAAASTSLPDQRAWELVSPAEKNGVGVAGIDGVSAGGVVEAAADGDSATFVSLGANEGSTGAPIGSQYLARRGPGGWLTASVAAPLLAQSYPTSDGGTPFKAFAADLSAGLMLNPGENPILSPDAPGGYENFYLRSESGFHPLLTEQPKAAASSFHVEFEGATSDLRHVVFESSAALTGNAVTGETNMYEWSNGLLELINVLPDGSAEPTKPLWLGSTFAGESGAISEDGRRVVWGEGKEGRLFVREGVGTPQAGTVQVDESREGADPSGGGMFLGASADGSRIFFADPRRLVKGATGSVGPGNLYEFRPEGEELRDLTVDGSDPGGAEVLGVLGVDTAGEYVYFVANGVLAAGASLGNCSVVGSAPGARCNLYARHGGVTRFIGQLSGNDGLAANEYRLGLASDWAETRGVRTARVSSDGRHLVFMSDADLTGYDSTRRDGGVCGMATLGASTVLCDEVYSYDAGSGVLSCVSCNPDGERPLGGSYIPGGTDYRSNTASYQSRALSEDGSRVFFTSSDALVPQDVNGREDVYEYEDGHVSLLSGGSGEADSSFVDASADGSDVFFITEDRLVGRDRDGLMDLYDAREGGGFEEPEAASPCSEEVGCRGPVGVAPVFGAAGSTIEAAPGNLVPGASAVPVKKATNKVRKVKKKTRAKRKARRRAAGARKRGRAGRASGRGR